MKKIGNIFMSLLALGLMACNGDYLPEVGPQTNPETTAVEASFTANYVGGVLDMEGVEPETELQLFTVEKSDNFMLISISAEALGGEQKKVNLNVTADGKVLASDLINVTKAIYGSARVERELFINTEAYGEVNGTRVNLHSTGTVFAKVLLEEPQFQDWLYVPGNAQGWSPDTAPALFHEGEGVYRGFAYLNGGFKLSKARDWDHGDFGQDAFQTADAGFEVGGTGDINCIDPGVYYVEADLEKGHFGATKIEYMGITGDFTGWNEGVEMTWNSTECCYEADAAVTEAGWKFRANGHTDPSWKVNLGGELSNLNVGGDNISVAGSKVKLYPCRTKSNKIYATVE